MPGPSQAAAGTLTTPLLQLLRCVLRGWLLQVSQLLLQPMSHPYNAWALDSGSTGSLPNTPQAAAGPALSSEPGKYLAEKAAVTLAASLRY